MNILQAVILGVVEGFTEFLPISSTGHLIITQKLLGLETIDSFFTTVIQSGAILAAVFFYRARLISICLDTLSLFKNGFRASPTSTNQKLGLWILIGTIPILVIAYALRRQIEVLQSSLLVVAISTIFFGVLFFAVEIWQKNRPNPKTISSVGLWPILIMGLAQAVAIIPGVSRSGATIVGGMSQNIRLRDSIDIAFIMGIPTLFAATIYKVATELDSINNERLILAGVGTLTSFIVGYFSIKLTLGSLQRYGFLPFMIYRILLGTILLVLFMNGVR